MAKNTATSAFFGIFRKNNQNARSIRLWRGISGSLIFSENTARYRAAMTLEISLRESAQGFESLPLRQSKPKSNTKVFGLGFSFAKIQDLSVFSVVGVPSFQPFRGSYRCVRIALSVVFTDGFMPRKVLDVRKECVRLSCQRQTKSPSGLSVGGLFAYRHAPERLRSRTPWNKSSA